MLRFSLLGSGSGGNAILLASGRTSILIDSGLSFRQAELRAAGLGMNISDVSAIFVTHEHGDHVKGAGVAARKLGVPVYMSRGTHEALPKSTGDIPRLELFEAGESIHHGDLHVTSYSIAHDAADPVAYSVECGGVKVGLAADLGHVSGLVKARLAGSQGLVLESNYCPVMLRNGGYPYALQQRIRGKHGHLSNADMCSLLADLMHDALQVVVLVHISAENNSHELAFDMARKTLAGHGAVLHVARQDEPTPFFQVSSR